jgi:tRNA-specific 2-thiouridylase
LAQSAFRLTRGFGFLFRKMEREQKKKVIVGLSGGVDSSVTAAILKKQGFDVFGVFMLFWQDKRTKANPALRDAKKVATILGIPLKIVDAKKRFRESVVKYFLEEYQSGRTPNPCVFCNEFMKFDVLSREMIDTGADFVATGHYARLRREIPNPKSQAPNKFQIRNSKSKTVVKLFKAKDESKDQSYFLYRLKQTQLVRTLFPLGEYKKEEVKKMAREFGLPVADKKESQDVCFIKDNDTRKFLEDNLKLKKGEIIDTEGNILGTHRGSALYTIGQRKGIEIGGTGPYYVLEKDLKKNRLIVTNEPGTTGLYSSRITVEKTVFPAGRPKLPVEAYMKTRYRETPSHAIIKNKEGGVLEIVFKEPQRAVTSGQSAVFYAKNGEVVGGGIII